MHLLLQHIIKVTNVMMVISAVTILLVPSIGIPVFVIFVGLLESYHFIRTRKSPAEVPLLNLSDGEKSIFQKYLLFFKYPITSMDCSAAYSLIQLSSLGVAVLVALKGSYVLAILIGLNYFLAATLAMRLNPLHFYRSSSRLNNPQRLELKNIESVISKIRSRPSSFTKSVEDIDDETIIVDVIMEKRANDEVVATITKSVLESSIFAGKQLTFHPVKQLSYAYDNNTFNRILSTLNIKLEYRKKLHELIILNSGYLSTDLIQREVGINNVVSAKLLHELIIHKQASVAPQARKLYLLRESREVSNE